MNLLRNPRFHNALKAVIILLALYLLGLKLNWQSLQNVTLTDSATTWLLCSTVFLVLFTGNISLDAYNWQLVQSIIRPISLYRAFMHNLKSYALAFITPVNSGELAGRYLVQTEGSHRQKTLFLTFWTHAPKLFAKISVAFPMLYALLRKEMPQTAWLLLLSTGLSLIAYFNLEKLISAVNHWQVKRFKLKNYLVKGRPLAHEKLRLIIVNMLRFLCFSGQLAAVLWLLQPEDVSASTLMAIPVFYFITAIIPTWAAVDFLVKGVLSLYFFKYFSNQEELFLIASTVVWLFNVAAPAIAGLVKFDTRELKKFRRKKN